MAIGPGGFYLVEVAKSSCVFLFGFASVEVCVKSRDFVAFRVISCGFVDRVFWAETVHEFTRTHTK